MRNQRERTMNWRRMLVVATVVAFGSMASESAAQQMRDALIASFGEEIQALNGKDLEAVIAHAQEDIVVFGLYSPFPIIGKTAFRALIQDYFDGNETASLKPAHQEYQVIGQTGVVWGLYQLETRPKGGAFQSVNGQYMFTYARPEGQWRIISMHFAPLPRGN